MIKLIVAVVLIGIMSVSAYAAGYGAIAYSSGTRAYGYGVRFSTKAAAQNEALSRCANYARDCRVVTNFVNACGSVAVGRDGGWGANWGTNRTAAERNALQTCSNHDRGCRVVAWACSQ